MGAEERTGYQHCNIPWLRNPGRKMQRGLGRQAKVSRRDMIRRSQWHSLGSTGGSEKEIDALFRLLYSS